jgi:hypothetical protein
LKADYKIRLSNTRIIAEALIKAIIILFASIIAFILMLYSYIRRDHKIKRFRVEPRVAGGSPVLIVAGTKERIKKDIEMFERNGRKLTEINYLQYRHLNRKQR